MVDASAGIGVSGHLQPRHSHGDQREQNGAQGIATRLLPSDAREASRASQKWMISAKLEGSKLSKVPWLQS